jgi:Helix-turn-helix domain
MSSWLHSRRRWPVKGGLYLSHKERRRLKLLEELKRIHTALAEVARVLEMSYRQAQRIWMRYRVEEDEGLVHRGRGRLSNNAIDGDLKRRILGCCEER